MPPRTENGLHIACDFDSGSIETIDCSVASNIRLKLRKDNLSGFSQWFHFHLSGGKGRECSINIEEVADSTFPGGWADYRAVASYDRVNWFRVDTTHDGQNLQIRINPAFSTIWFAYFEPYSWQRHQHLISRSSMMPDVAVELLGTTPDGHDLELLRIGTPDTEKKKIWVIARQHPGESMAEWFVEGMLEKLFAADSGVTQHLLQKCTFYVVPNMNPDGSIRGYIRSNAKGMDLNRQWLDPDPEQSPEVFWVKEKLQQTGVDAFLDIHGDECIPYVFAAGCECNESFSTKQKHLQDVFNAALLAVNPDYQSDHGFGERQFTEETLTLASNWVGHHFNCLSLTFEMPFKDARNNPSPISGWNGARSARLGSDVVLALSTLYGDD